VTRLRSYLDYRKDKKTAFSLSINIDALMTPYRNRGVPSIYGFLTATSDRRGGPILSRAFAVTNDHHGTITVASHPARRCAGEENSAIDLVINLWGGWILLDLKPWIHRPRNKNLRMSLRISRSKTFLLQSYGPTSCYLRARASIPNTKVKIIDCKLLLFP
jgi:hypothetical protein